MLLSAAWRRYLELHNGVVHEKTTGPEKNKHNVKAIETDRIVVEFH
jgi:hypothetical protein